MNRPDRCSNPIPRQRGAALFMALIFLLILTILGVFGMNVSRLENLMAGNAQFQTTALNNAEYVLVRAERDLTTIETELYNGTGTNPFIGTNTGDAYYCGNADSCLMATGDGTSLVLASLNWTTYGSTTVELPDVNDVVGADGTGQYIIMDAGYDNASGECATQQCMLEHLAGAQVHVFLVTAQSASSRGARRIVQSAFVTRPLPLVAPASESSSETSSNTTSDATQ
jgi:Tfp pilus assembly protein PilX